LGLESTQFTKSELNKAYRTQSRVYHPDKNLDFDTTDKFIEIKLAQEVLEVPFMRSSYDLFGQTRFDQEQKLWDSLSLQFNMEEEAQAAEMNA